MDRNEIIARLRHMVRIGDAMNACRTESNNVLAAAADLLEVGGWVSVGERLPDADIPVILARFDGENTSVNIGFRRDGDTRHWWARVGPDDHRKYVRIASFGLYTHWHPTTSLGSDHD